MTRNDTWFWCYCSKTTDVLTKYCRGSVNQDLDFWKLCEVLVERSKWCGQEGSTQGRNCSDFGGCRRGQSSVLSVESLDCHSPFPCPCWYSHQICLLSLVGSLSSQEKSWSLKQSGPAFLLELGNIWGFVCSHESGTEGKIQPKSEQKIRSMRENWSWLKMGKNRSYLVGRGN